MIPAHLRIPSLFTGKTDLEDPNARDGSRAESSRRQPKAKPIKWTGGLDYWWVGDERKPSATVRRFTDGYVATVGAESQTFDHVSLAGAWVEEKLR